MSGVELAEALRATRPSIPFLLITGFANLTDADSGGLPRLAKPFREVEIAARVGKLLEGATAAKSELRILVVEDEPAIALELVSVIEEEAGCAVMGVASSVDEALALIALERPNGAVLDANLNGSTSVKIAEALRREDTPFFVLSGYSAKSSLPPPLNEAPFLQKPYREGELLQQIRSLLAANRKSNRGA
jgi:CheY-like chemotaxis protein